MITDRQKQIIETALTLISDNGLKNFTTRNLAEKIGISEAALYRHFESKTRILIGIIEYYDSESTEGLIEILKSNEQPLIKIKHFFMNRLTTFAKKPELAHLMILDDLLFTDPAAANALNEIMHKHKDMIFDIINEGRLKGEIKTDIPEKDMFRITFGAFRLIITQWIISNYNFDILEEGNNLINSIIKLISK